VIDPGRLGVWLLVVSLVAILVEGVLAGLWTVRLARRAKVLSERLAAERLLVQSDLLRLSAALAETTALWQPYERALRWFRHPLVVALMQSYARRRAAAR